jgi:sterol desaturase/sphingolipid hydroxylase (fatty acid hydroxylase superfamily)
MLEQLGPHLQSGLEQVVRLSLWLAILTTIFIPLERFFAAQPEKILRKGVAADLCYYFLNSLTTASFLSVPVALLAWSVHRIIPESVLAWSAALPFWARVATGFVAGEVGYYWGHRLSHQIPFLWRFHAIHHSAQHIDFLVNTRAHPVDMVFGRFCGLIPIYILGLGGPTNSAGSQVPIVVALIGTVWGFFIHANLNWRFGPLEWLISTPAFHHWHHTLTPINRNYASTLPWLDRIFGSHYLPHDMPKTYGIKAKMPDSILDQLAYPLDSVSPPVDQQPANTTFDVTHQTDASVKKSEEASISV